MRSLTEIARERRELTARSAVHRNAVASVYRQLRKPLGAADHVLGVAHFVRAHPLLFGGGVAAIVVLLRGKVRMLPTVGRGLAAWRVMRAVSAWLIDRQRSRETAAR